MTRLLWVVYVVLAAALYFLLTGVVVNGHPFWSFVSVLFISPVLMAYVGWCERRHLGEMFHPAKQSWAFLFGDTIVLPATFAILAFIYVTSYGVEISSQLSVFSWWGLGAFAVGYVGGILFNSNERKVYGERGFGSNVRSAGKVYHDLVVVPVLLGAGVFAAWPLVYAGGVWFVRLPYNVWMIVAACCVALWGALAMYDGIRDKEQLEAHDEGLLPYGHVPASRTNAGSKKG